MNTIQVKGGTFTDFNPLRFIERLFEEAEKSQNKGTDVSVTVRRLAPKQEGVA